MKLAFLSDIHGNPMALDAVLADSEAQGDVDGYCFLGDYSAIGYDPLTVLERITRLPNAVYIRGNTDRYLFAGDRPPPYHEEVLENLELLATLQDIERNFAWSQGYLTSDGWLEWLENLPIEHRFNLPDGTRVLLVHAAPGRDDGQGFEPSQTDEEIMVMLEDVLPDADVVVVGHTHWQMDRTVNGIRIINPGCVSNPRPHEKRASYLVMDADENGYTAEFRLVAYDNQAVIDAGYRVRQPAADFLAKFQRGEIP